MRIALGERLDELLPTTRTCQAYVFVGWPVGVPRTTTDRRFGTATVLHKLEQTRGVIDRSCNLQE